VRIAYDSGSVADTAPKPFVFVLMPFAKEFDDAYKLAIRPAAEAAGAYCERIDEQIFADNILARLYNQIAKADLLVADMTGRNANVFYEVGYAHALGKTVVLVTRREDDIPFDLKHYPHIIYGDSLTTLKDELSARVAYHLSQPRGEPPPPSSRLQFAIAKTILVSDAVVPLRLADHPRIDQPAQITVGIHNPTSVPMENRDLSVALILPDEIQPFDGVGSFRLPDGRRYYEVALPPRLLPGAWSRTTLVVREEDLFSLMGEDKPAELIVHTIAGPISTRFWLHGTNE
jgi:hypothetical protein